MSGGRRLAAQPTAPYLEAITAYGFRGSTRFHVPGHKGGEGADPGLRSALGDDALLLDVPQDIEGIDVGPSPTPYERAEQLAADAYGARRTWFLTNGATQGNHALCLALAPPGARVVVQRNSHASMIDGLVLSGGLPSFVAPEYDEGLGIAHGVTPEALADALEGAPGAAAAFIVSPTYYGMAADVAGCAEVAHRAGVALIVDAAWGSHFGFHEALPRSPLALGADAMLASTHKIVGSLTQSAMLLVAASGRVDTDAVARAVRLVRSTSPSSLLMASLDAARRQLRVHGETLLDRTIRAAVEARAALDAVHGCSVLGDGLVGQPGIAGWDPLRIVVDVRDTGCTGYEVAEALRSSYDIYVELATHATLVFVLGIAQPVEPLERLAHDFAETVKHIARPGRARALTRPPVAFQRETEIPPREAFLGQSVAVPVADAIGRISCEAIAGYPPGVPSLLPGERITGEVIAYLQELTAAGARLHGAADPSLATIRVLAVHRDIIAEAVARALAEDVGTGDVTTAATVDAGASARAVITQKAPGVVFGLDVAEATFRALDPEVRAWRLAPEREWREGGPVLRLEGAARGMLTAERTALNFLQRLSGVATAAARYVREVEDTPARILDTRKTTPGMRALEKAAVAAGGATNHRAGLYDAILIKENHAALAGGIAEAVRRARAAAPDLPLEVEARSLAEVEDAVAAGAGRILLDNMSIGELREAVVYVGGRAELEASGGITLETVRDAASTGVDFISVGALTHSAGALDFSLILEPLS